MRERWATTATTVGDTTSRRIESTTHSGDGSGAAGSQTQHRLLRQRLLLMLLPLLASVLMSAVCCNSGAGGSVSVAHDSLQCLTKSVCLSVHGALDIACCGAAAPAAGGMLWNSSVV